MPQTFRDDSAIERARAILSGKGLDRDAWATERYNDALRAKRRRPYFAVARLATMPDAGSGAGVLPNNAPVNLLVPSKAGFPRRTVIYSAMSDAMKATALFNIVRRRGLPEDVYQQSLLSSPQRALYFCGDMLHSTLRIGPAEWFDFPEPLIYEKGEPLNLLGVGDGADANMSNTFMVFRGEQEYDANSPEGTFEQGETNDILDQIRNRERQTGSVTLAVDFSVASTYTEVPLPIVERWSLLLGFASATATAVSTFLRWCTVDIQDERGQKWSNEPIPITALASLPFDSSNTQEFYRPLITPVLLRPGSQKRLVVTLAKRTATGGGDYPASVTADTVGKLVAILKTV